MNKNHHPNNKIPREVQNRLHHPNQFKTKISALRSGKKKQNEEQKDQGIRNQMSQEVEFMLENQPKNIKQKSKKYVAVKKTLQSLLDKKILFPNQQSIYNSLVDSKLSSQYSTLTFHGHHLPPSTFKNKQIGSRLESSGMSSSQNIRTPQQPVRAPPVVQLRPSYSQIIVPYQKAKQKQSTQIKTIKRRDTMTKFITDKNTVRSFSKDSLIHQVGNQQPDSLLISKQNQYYYNFGFDYDAMRSAAGINRMNNSHSISAFGTPQRVIPFPKKTQLNEKSRKERILKAAMKRQQINLKKI